MWKWENVLNLPAALPGWILLYYFSYVLLFLPFSGVGNVITSIGYYSFLLVGTLTQLYAYSNPLYPSATFTPPATLNFSLNTSFAGNIFCIAGAIIWIGLTFSQKYSKKMP
jgi:hypothetical protein